MTTQEILETARALIEDPAKWTGAGVLRDGRGRVCALGACIDAYEGEFERVSALEAAYELLDDAAMALHCTPYIVCVNDDLGHAAVLECFDYAIEAAA